MTTDAVQVDVHALVAADRGARLPEVAGRVVRLVAAGLEPGVAARGGRPEARAALRSAVLAAADAGLAVEIDAPLADAQSSPADFAEAVSELCRLALRVDVPVRWVGTLPAEVHPWIAAAGALSSEARFTSAVTRLYEAWKPLVDASGADGWASDALVRRLDDRARRLVFSMLRDAWLGRTEDWPGPALAKDAALRRAIEVLGEEGKWRKPFRQFTYDTERRMVLIPTWQCELRCSYCWIPKQDGRVMAPPVMERAVEMLLSTEQESLLLQFFGGEALIEADNVRHAMDYATRRASEVGKKVRFVVSSNGWSLDAKALSWLKNYPVRLELSLDGDPRTQDRYRPSRWAAESSYAHSIATHKDAILASGLEQFVIMVVHATNVDAMPANFFHIADLGFRHIQINYMQGRVWKPQEVESFARGLHAIGRELQRRWAKGETLEFINMQHRPMAMRLNGEVTVDWDGTIYGGNGFLHETEHKEAFVVGHLGDVTGVDRYWVDATDNAFLLDIAYRPKVVENNVEVGKIMASFIKWMTKQGYGPKGPLPPEARERVPA